MSLRRTSLALASLLLSGCASVPTDLVGVMNQVTGLGTQVTNWSKSLGSANITAAALKALSGFGETAGNLSSALGGLLGGQAGQALAPDAKQLAGGVQQGLETMSGFKLEDLLELAPADRKTQVDTFVGASNSVSDLAKQFLGAVGG